MLTRMWLSTVVSLLVGMVAGGAMILRVAPAPEQKDRVDFSKMFDYSKMAGPNHIRGESLRTRPFRMTGPRLRLQP